MKIFKTQDGLSLLEMLMVLVVGSVLSVMVMMYFHSVQQTKKINQAIQLIEQVLSVADNYRQPRKIKMVDGVPTMSGSNRFAFKGISTNTIARSGFLPQQYIRYNGTSPATMTTPWFGNSQLRVEEGGNTRDRFLYRVILSNIPNYACETLASQLRILQTKTNVASGNTNDKYNEGTSCHGNTLYINSYPVNTS